MAASNWEVTHVAASQGRMTGDERLALRGPLWQNLLWQRLLWQSLLWQNLPWQTPLGQRRRWQSQPPLP